MKGTVFCKNIEFLDSGLESLELEFQGITIDGIDGEKLTQIKTIGSQNSLWETGKTYKVERVN